MLEIARVVRQNYWLLLLLPLTALLVMVKTTAATFFQIAGSQCLVIKGGLLSVVGEMGRWAYHLFFCWCLLLLVSVGIHLNL